MKKIFILSVLCLAACVQSIESCSGLKRLGSEPKDCEFLYTINTSVTNYNLEDAYDFLEKRIMEQHMVGDSYYIVQQETEKNEEAIFGPENTFKFKTKVYKCSD